MKTLRLGKNFSIQFYGLQCFLGLCVSYFHFHLVQQAVMYMSWWQPNAHRSILFPWLFLSGCLVLWVLDPNMKSDTLLKTTTPRWWLLKKPCVVEQKAPPPRPLSEPPGEEQAKKGRQGLTVTQRNGQKTQRMMDLINDHFSNAHVF